ncbi:MAG: hypothetical protein ISR65_03490 [Bacteriovoracaceae bacterium]|nr:hypothetical protein [Bacteriovoracaceae bacterium]
MTALDDLDDLDFEYETKATSTATAPTKRGLTSPTKTATQAPPVEDETKPLLSVVKNDTPAPKQPKKISQVSGDMRSRIDEIERNAEIRIAVAEEKVYIIANLFAEAKLLEFQVNKILQAIESNNPAIEKKFQRISKLLAEHAEIRKF